MKLDKNYFKVLERRRKESRAYKKFQLVGLEIAQILLDEKHKALYIKLAKELSADLLLRLAKEIAERKDVRNKGAYFMRMIEVVKKT